MVFVKEIQSQFLFSKRIKFHSFNRYYVLTVCQGLVLQQVRQKFGFNRVHILVGQMVDKNRVDINYKVR